MTGTVTSKGQVTLPVAVRRHLGIEAGTKLDFVVREDGRIEVEVISGTLEELKKVLPAPGNVLSIEEIRDVSGPGGVNP